MAEMQLWALGQAADKPMWARQWSDLTCADMTTDVTAYFNHEWSQQLYLKSTMQEFFRAYGAACCGSIDQTRDPCAASSKYVIKVQVRSLSGILLGERQRKGGRATDYVWMSLVLYWLGLMESGF